VERGVLPSGGVCSERCDLGARGPCRALCTRLWRSSVVRCRSSSAAACTYTLPQNHINSTPGLLPPSPGRCLSVTCLPLVQRLTAAAVQSEALLFMQRLTAAAVQSEALLFMQRLTAATVQSEALLFMQRLTAATVQSEALLFIPGRCFSVTCLPLVQRLTAATVQSEALLFMAGACAGLVACGAAAGASCLPPHRVYFLSHS
jgi:hypothetical protein